MPERSGISEGVFLALASALSYAMAFALNAGYATHFGLPPLLLSPTLGDVLQAAGAIGSIALPTWGILVFVWPLLPEANSALKRAIYHWLVINIISAAIIILILEGSEVLWEWLVSMSLYFTFSILIIPLLLHRNIAGYENKLLEQEQLNKFKSSNSIFIPIATRYGWDSILLFSLAITIIALTYRVGSYLARNQTEYFVLTDRPEYVVSKMGEETVFLAGYDPKTLSLTGSYQIEKLSDSKGWSFQKQQIGKLKAKQDNAESKSLPSNHKQS
jgi:hypothetical protein